MYEPHPILVLASSKLISVTQGIATIPTHVEPDGALGATTERHFFSESALSPITFCNTTVTLDLLLHQHDNQLSIVLPKFSEQQVEEGHAASDINLIALVFYHRWWGLLYQTITLLWVVVLREPSIFAQINQVDANYVQVLRENRLWIWLAQKLL